MTEKSRGYRRKLVTRIYYVISRKSGSPQDTKLEDCKRNRHVRYKKEWSEMDKQSILENGDAKMSWDYAATI